jgi:hypothetical protein
LVYNVTGSAETGWNLRYTTASGNILEDYKPGATGTYAATATQSAPVGNWLMQIIAVSPGATATQPPVFSVTPSFYWLSQTVAITCPSCSKIVYTIDGSIPSVNSSGTIVNGNLYSSSLSITAPTYLQALAWSSGGGPSALTKGQYNIGSAGASVAWPIKASGTYLTDSAGNPYMLVGDSPWTLMCSLTPTLTGTNSMGAFFADRKSHGFNAVLVEIIGSSGDGCSTTNAALDGTLPFTSGSNENSYIYSSENSAYFAEVDTMLNIAAANGITLVLGTISTAPVTSTGTVSSGPLNAARLSSNSYSGMYAFGQYLGNRYKNYGNIIWFTAEDFQDWTSSTTYNGYTDNQLMAAIAAGIANTDSNHLSTEELNYNTSYGNQDTGFAATQTINSIYTYTANGDETYLGYNSVPAQPIVLIEGDYEYSSYSFLKPWPSGGGCTGTNGNIPPTTSSPLYDLSTRLTQWWHVTAGGLGGFLYGSCVTGSSVVPSGWPTYIDSPGATQIAYWNSFWSALPWQNMQPDQTHQVVTAGYGTYQTGASSGGCVSPFPGSCNLFADNYVTTLWNPNGTLAVIYLPGTTTGTTTPTFAVNTGITVNLAKFVGNTTAQWFDPSAGSYTAISGSPFTNSGTHVFTPPSLNSRGAPDWVLLLQSTANVQTLANPTFSPVAGAYASTQTVTISGPSGATFCYTTDGSTPTEVANLCSGGTTQTYTTALTVSTSQTVKALATESGYNDSGIASAGYTINGSVGVPTFSLLGKAPNLQAVQITSATSGATLCYTTNGVAPTTNSGGTCTSGTTLANGGSINLTVGTILKVIATESAYTDSAVATAIVLVEGQPGSPAPLKGLI